MEFGPRFKKVLAKHGITQAKFCEDVNFHKGQASLILNGKDNPSSDFIFKAISYVPEIDLDYLFGDVTGHIVEEPGEEYTPNPSKIINEIEWKLNYLKRIMTQK